MISISFKNYQNLKKKSLLLKPQDKKLQFFYMNESKKRKTPIK